ncbi:MAG TPA: hypothetical protein VGG39_05515 [Polyangiaceae bacterium]
MTDATEPLIKGAAIREFLLWHDRKFGHDETRALLTGVPPALLATIEPSQPALGILGASWYPTTLTHPMLDRLAARVGNEARDVARDANRDVVPRMIRGVYRVLFRAVASPELYARHVPRLWRRLHTTGDRTVVLRAPGEAHSTTRDWPGHHPVLCWMTIYTMAYVFEAMGYRQWSVERLACVGHGARACETLLRFEK